MQPIRSFDGINRDRRRLLRAAAMAMAAAPFALSSSAAAQSSGLPAIKPGTHTSFGPLKQIDAGLLNVGYAEAGPAGGPPVILLHGWPYDIHSFVDVAPLLASAGYRVIVPYLRGYGTTRFLASDTVRNGEPAALAQDIIDLMDALKIEKATIGGFDWGARTANIIAALWPERCKAMVSVSGYLIGSQESGKVPLPPQAELQWWYQYYFATERGEDGYAKNRHDFSQLIWQLASPKWAFDDATFDRSAQAFDNPDHVAIVIHNYRWRLDLAKGEAKYDDLEKQLAALPVISVPTITLEGDANGAPHPPPSAYAKTLHRQIRAPRYHRRHRAQSAAGSAAGLCAGGDRRRSRLIERASEKAPNHVRGLFRTRCRGRYAAGLPIDIFRVPTPSTPHSILSPGETAATPAGVPVMMMSPAAISTCCDNCQMISGTLQISSVRSPFCRSVPLTESQILPFERMADPGSRLQRGAGRGMVERLADFPGPFLLARGLLQVAARQIDADRIAVDVIERLVGRDVQAAALHRHDQLDLVMQVLGQRRVGNGGAIGLEHVGMLGEEERRRTLVVSHLADVLEIVAPDAPDAANGKGFRFAGDRDRGLRSGGNDKGRGVHGGRSERCG